MAEPTKPGAGRLLGAIILAVVATILVAMFVRPGPQASDKSEPVKQKGENPSPRKSGIKPLVFTDSNFDSDVLKSKVPVLVDVWATWCGPCRILAPIIDQLAGDNEGRAKVGKLDADANQKTAMKYGVQGLPTILVFKNGGVFKKFVGVTGKNDLQAALDGAMK